MEPAPSLLTHLIGREMSERDVAVVYLEDGKWVSSQKTPTELVWQRKLKEPPDLKRSNRQEQSHV